jgi:hypothetical protein
MCAFSFTQKLGPRNTPLTAELDSFAFQEALQSESGSCLGCDGIKEYFVSSGV